MNVSISELIQALMQEHSAAFSPPPLSLYAFYDGGVYVFLKVCDIATI